jgi:hypothetical protein
MSYVIAAPEIMTSAAADLATIGSTLSAASTAAAAPTTGLPAAAEDEVSAATAKLFGGYAQEYQAVLAQAAAFHDEAANASAIFGALGQLTSPIDSLLVGAPPAPTPLAMSPLPAPTVALVMGGSGEPIPPAPYVEALNYLSVTFSPLANVQGLVTPEGLYPLTGIKSMTFDASVSQGVQILDSAIKQQIAGGNSVAVFGVSESAVISSLEMKNLAAMGAGAPTANQLGFTLVGDQMNPNGGILARFPGFPAGQPLQLPSWGLTFYGATPPNTIYPTNVYTLEYDGFADFPQYPINVISDLNAFVGILNVHTAST